MPRPVDLRYFLGIGIGIDTGVVSNYVANGVSQSGASPTRNRLSSWIGVGVAPVWQCYMRRLTGTEWDTICISAMANGAQLKNDVLPDVSSPRFLLNSPDDCFDETSNTTARTGLSAHLKTVQRLSLNLRNEGLKPAASAWLRYWRDPRSAAALVHPPARQSVPMTRRQFTGSLTAATRISPSSRSGSGAAGTIRP